MATILHTIYIFINDEELKNTKTHICRIVVNIQFVSYTLYALDRVVLASISRVFVMT